MSRTTLLPATVWTGVAVAGAVVLTHPVARADVLYPPGPSAQCVLGSKGKADECLRCVAPLADPRRCEDALGRYGFALRCLLGSPVETSQLWCRPATGASQPVPDELRTSLATPPPAPSAPASAPAPPPSAPASAPATPPSAPASAPATPPSAPAPPIGSRDPATATAVGTAPAPPVPPVAVRPPPPACGGDCSVAPPAPLVGALAWLGCVAALWRRRSRRRAGLRSH